MKMTYEEFIKLAEDQNLTVGCHYSDLYLCGDYKDCKKFHPIAEKYIDSIVHIFKDNSTDEEGKFLLDIPFAYKPYWTNKGM